MLLSETWRETPICKASFVKTKHRTQFFLIEGVLQLGQEHGTVLFSNVSRFRNPVDRKRTLDPYTAFSSVPHR